MQIWIDLPEEMVARLDELADARKTSRVDLIRLAVTDFLAREREFSEAFGLWAARGEDGVAYQGRVRREWKR